MRQRGVVLACSISDTARHQRLPDNNHESMTSEEMLAGLTVDDPRLSLRCTHGVCAQHYDVANSCENADEYPRKFRSVGRR
jgi:starvation-inducible DNA-binding protein